MDWISPKKKLPPQGKKILCFDKGDIYVALRFGKYWFPIPFLDARFATHLEPELWADIVPPEGYTGLIRTVVKERMYNMDELEINHYDSYKILVDGFLKAMNTPIN